MQPIVAAVLGAFGTALVSIYIYYHRIKFDYAGEVIQWKRDVRVWANSVIERMKRLEAALAAETETTALAKAEDRGRSILEELNILVAQGRLMFPNSHRWGRTPEDKDAARHGYRNLVLDPVKTTVDRGFDGKLTSREVAMMNGSFLTLVDAILAPLEWNRLLCRYIEDSDYGGGARTVHFILNPEETDAVPPGSGYWETVLDSGQVPTAKGCLEAWERCGK